MSALVVTVVVALAGLLSVARPSSRLPTSGVGAVGLRSAADRRAGGRWRRAPGRQPPAEPARTVSELAALLKAGIPAARAWGHLEAIPAADVRAGTWAAVVHAAAVAAAANGDVPAALRDAARGCRQPSQASAARGLAAAWAVAQATGAPTAQVLERLAGALRQDEDAEGARAAAMAGPRATARVLTWLPVGGLVVGQVMGSDPVAVLLGSPLGWGCAATGAALTLLAAAWTRRLVRAAEATP